MASGVKVSEEVKKLFSDMKVVKNDADHNERIRLVTFVIDGDFIVIEHTFKEKDLKDEDPYKFFLKQLEGGKCRYVLYDCHFETKECCKKEELIFVLWCCESSKIKDKMNYASSKDAIKKVFGGLKHDMQVNDISDICHRDAFAEKLGKGIIKLEGECLDKH